MERLEATVAHAAAMLRQAEAEILACLALHREHRGLMRSANAIEPVDAAVDPRAKVSEPFPNSGSLLRLAIADLLEQHDGPRHSVRAS
ncbi:MAG: transposase [Candidatus Dormibacteria bacterium]